VTLKHAAHASIGRASMPREVASRSRLLAPTTQKDGGARTCLFLFQNPKHTVEQTEENQTEPAGGQANDSIGSASRLIRRTNKQQMHHLARVSSKKDLQ